MNRQLYIVIFTITVQPLLITEVLVYVSLRVLDFIVFADVHRIAFLLLDNVSPSVVPRLIVAGTSLLGSSSSIEETVQDLRLTPSQEPPLMARKMLSGLISRGTGVLLTIWKLNRDKKYSKSTFTSINANLWPMQIRGP